MSNKSRALLKAIYYVIGIIVAGFVTTSYDLLRGIILAIYIICGAVISSNLKLPLLSKLHLYNVDKQYYSSVDTFCNILFSMVSIIPLIYWIMQRL